MSSSCSYIVACFSFNLQRERNALNKVPLEKKSHIILQPAYHMNKKAFRQTMF